VAKDVVYVHHRPVEFHAFRSPGGMVGRWTRDRAEDVANHARLLAPKPGQSKGYATGKTAANIHASGPTMGRSGPEATVVADTKYSLVVHEPTRPHIIKPRFTNKLVFFSRRAGRVLFKDKVSHPGTKGNPFLVKALRAVFGGPGR
jgi:hypothetical protein